MRDDPALRDIPIAIGGDPGRRGVIATCNYPARAFGVRSAMASAQAIKLCPSLKIIPGNMDKYRLASQQIMRIFSDYTALIEPLSLDEAFLDVTESTACRGSATLIAEELRQRVAAEVGITISAGVAPNKFLAKIASDWNKPDGLWVITPPHVADFVETLPVRKLHGVGPATAEKLLGLGVSTCADLRRLGAVRLVEALGGFGERLFQLAQGVDHRPVSTEHRRKSVSVEHTYVQDLPGLNQCEEQLPELLKRLEMRKARLDGSYRISGAVVKVKFSDFVQTTVEAACAEPDAAVYRVLLQEALQRHPPPVRLLGVGVRLTDRLEASGGRQLLLFDNEPGDNAPGDKKSIA